MTYIISHQTISQKISTFREQLNLLKPLNCEDPNNKMLKFPTKYKHTKVKKKYGSPQQSRPKTLDVGTVEHPISSPPMKKVFKLFLQKKHDL